MILIKILFIFFKIYYMNSIYFLQFKKILHKNLLLNYRSRQYIKQLTFIIILVLVILIVSFFGHQENTLSFYISLAIINFMRFMVQSLVKEKQNRQKELQVAMGANPIIYILAWCTYYIIIGIYNLILIVLALELLGIFTQNQLSLTSFLLLYLLFMLSTITFALFLTVFFSHSKSASQGATFIQIFQSCLIFLTQIQSVKNNKQLLQFLSVLPAFSFDLGFILRCPNTQIVLSYTKSNTNLFLALDILIYLILFLYLNEVIPNQFGTQKHPLFIFKWLFPTRQQNQLDLPLQNYEDQSSAKYHQKKYNQRPLIRINGLNKNYQQHKVIQNLSFNIYQSQILCVLGHNGTGKTTLMNLLSGLISEDSGQIFIKDKKIKENLEQMRLQIGLCMQNDILYHQLTVQQHLQFYGIIKGLNKNQIQNEVENTINKCSLASQRMKPMKHLSGGNKRKLSLANSFIGKSRILFLDEPTSNLDPVTRRLIWNMIYEAKLMGKTIIMSTHHIQEAQILSQRIGIMNGGNFYILGDNEFIKNKFGIGYHLNINENEIRKKQNCKQIIKQQIKNAIIKQIDNQNTLEAILPYSQISKFPSLFQKIQKITPKMFIKHYSLQDIFINLSLNPDFKQFAIHSQLEINQNLIDKLQPTYSFSSQYKSLFKKKFLLTIRSKLAILSCFLPLILIITGTIISFVFVDYTSLHISKKLKINLQSQIVSFFIIFSFIFNTSAYCGSLVQQKQNKLKYLLNVSGMSKYPYWIANFTFDLIIFMIPVIAFFIIILFFGQKSQFLTQKIMYFIPLFILFGCAFIAYSYCFSFAFQTSDSAYKYFPIINLLIFYILPSIPIIVKPELFLSKYIMPFVSPFVALSYCFHKTKISKLLLNNNQEEYQFEYIFLVLLIQLLIYIGILALLQYSRYELKDRMEVVSFQNQNSQDAFKQEQKVINIEKQGIDKPLLVHSIYKKYPNQNVALSNISFAIQSKQILTIIGPNSAGKSTLMNILTARIPKSYGYFKFNKNNIISNLQNQFIKVGVCPQQNILYQVLTVQQHLRLFASIKGFKDQNLDDLVNRILKSIQLDSYKNIPIYQLSGGTKRKVSIGIALVGNPSLIFFDQPTVGLDQSSKRQVWKILKYCKNIRDASIIVTSNEMQEAQELSDKIGVLVKGRLRCIGTKSDLKSKYKDGYYINVGVVQLNKLEELQRKLNERNIKSNKFEMKQQKKVIYILSFQSKFRFSEIFKILLEEMKKKHILSFQISQSTLQQIFLLFCRQQFQFDNSLSEISSISYIQSQDFCCFQSIGSTCYFRF